MPPEAAEHARTLPQLPCPPLHHGFYKRTMFQSCWVSGCSHFRRELPFFAALRRRCLDPHLGRESKLGLRLPLLGLGRRRLMRNEVNQSSRLRPNVRERQPPKAQRTSSSCLLGRRCLADRPTVSVWAASLRLAIPSSAATRVASLTKNPVGRPRDGQRPSLWPTRRLPLPPPSWLALGAWGVHGRQRHWHRRSRLKAADAVSATFLHALRRPLSDQPELSTGRPRGQQASTLETNCCGDRLDV